MKLQTRIRAHHDTQSSYTSRDIENIWHSPIITKYAIVSFDYPMAIAYYRLRCYDIVKYLYIDIKTRNCEDDEDMLSSLIAGIAFYNDVNMILYFHEMNEPLLHKEYRIIDYAISGGAREVSMFLLSHYRYPPEKLRESFEFAQSKGYFKK